MASPLGHGLVGLGCAGLVAQVIGSPLSPELALGAVVASNVPDLDFLGPVFGVPTKRAHRHATHSLLVAGTLALSAGWVWSLLPDGPDLGLALPCLGALLSHLALDLVTTSPAAAARGHGLPLLWPITSRRWIIAQPLYHTANFEDICSTKQRLIAAIPELYVLGPAAAALVLAAYAFRSSVGLPVNSAGVLTQFFRLLGHQ